MTSDALKMKIADFKKREKDGLIERYEGSQAQADLGGEALTDNLGVHKKANPGEDYRISPSFNRNKRYGI